MVWLRMPTDLDVTQSSAGVWVRVGEEHAMYCHRVGGQLAGLAPTELKSFLCPVLAPCVCASMHETNLLKI